MPDDDESDDENPGEELLRIGAPVPRLQPCWIPAGEAMPKYHITI